MLPALLLLLVPPADGGRRKKKNEPTGPPVPSLPDATTAPPYPIAAPQLQGPTSVLALEGLTRNAVSFRFETDLSMLQDLDRDAVDAIFAQLAADPRWRVGRGTDGGRIAMLRNSDAEPRIGPGGWDLHAETCFRVAIRETSGGGEWTTSERVTRAEAKDGAMDLVGFRPDGGLCARLATALRVEGAITLEVFEAGSSDGRPVTLAAIGDLPFELASYAFAVRTIERDGYDSLALPEHEPRPVFGPSLAVAAADGVLSVGGRINAHERGMSWVRILDASDAPFEETAVGVGTLEQIGWSHDEAYGFYWQSAVSLPSGPAFDGTTELWFLPAEGIDDEPPVARRLHAESVTIPAR